MPRPSKPVSMLHGVEKAAEVLRAFDYNVHPEEFFFYELHRLIEEDQASFDHAAFRSLVDEGIRAHVEDNLQVRAQLAGLLREADLKGEARTAAMRAVTALEDLEADLCNVAVLVRSYVSYLLSRLESLEDVPEEDKVSTAADLLFESTGDRSAAETALDVLCGTPTPVSARVLAHAISEPLLDEDLEGRAFMALKNFWPLPRAYMLYNLRGHPHEDIPVRWFQLFIEMDELTGVELALEEFRAHGENPDYHEDLLALMEVLHGSRDPELEEKMLGLLNAADTAGPVAASIRDFLKNHKAPAQRPGPSAWERRARALNLNRRYRAAAALWDAGKKDEALQVLDEIQKEEPGEPFSRMLHSLLRSSS